MWNYTKCTTSDREEKIRELTAAFCGDNDCLRYLSEVQSCISSTRTTIVLLQDLDSNRLIEMDYVPVNDYIFHVVNIRPNGIKNQGPDCRNIEEAAAQFMKFPGGDCSQQF